MGQGMLTIGALVLLGVTVLLVNQNNLQNGVILNQTETGVYAVSLATSYIQTASEFNFDEKTGLAGGAIASDATGSKLVAPTTTNLTASSSLGRDATPPPEIINDEKTFDDFDDFKDFAKFDTIKGVDIFKTLADVYYIQPGFPDVPVTGPTYFKRLDIRTFGTVNRQAYTGEGTGGVDTVKLSYIFSYFR